MAINDALPLEIVLPASRSRLLSQGPECTSLTNFNKIKQCIAE